MPVILDRISKSYSDSRNDRVIFQDMSARLEPGQISVVIGKSGVGKSSLLNLISGIDVPDNGSIMVNGQCVTDMDDTQRTLFRRRKIGFIYQFFNLIPVLSVIENITLIAELDGRSPAEYRPRALSLLEQVGLAGRMDDFPDTLSGGEQQRVAIVRSLVNDPGIILADEPTGNLDAETGLAILALLTDLVRTRGKTLIMVTHSPEAVTFAHHVFAVRNGQLEPQPESTGRP